MADEAYLTGITKDDVCIFIAPQKMQKKRHDMMITAVQKKGFNIRGELSSDVTHIVADLDSIEQAERLLDICADKFTIVSSKWITACLKVGKLVHVDDEYLLMREKKPNQLKELKKDLSLPDYSCQRATPLHHHNEIFTEALEVLEKYADMRDEGNDYTRALAFRRGACTLKSLPRRVRNVREVQHLPDIGDHVKRVIKEILDEGFCAEVEDIKSSKQYKLLKLFTSIFGIGPSTAKRWINVGYESLHDVMDSDDSAFSDQRVCMGISYYHDLNLPVSKDEALHIENTVRKTAEKILPGVIVQMTGGFRRGKDFGHDVDVLMTHPQEGQERGLLSQILRALEKSLLHGTSERNTFTEDKLSSMIDSKQTPKTTLDHFEKWIGVMKIDTDILPAAHKQKKMKIEPYVGKGCHKVAFAPGDRNWILRRVDMIVVPYSQYFYALVGWTGSRQFNRSARLYASRELNMKLTSHGLYDFTKGRSIPAKSEEEVFEHLKLTYREPWERNC